MRSRTLFDFGQRFLAMDIAFLRHPLNRTYGEGGKGI